MDQLLQNLTDPTVSLVLGGAIVTYVTQWAKTKWGWKPCGDALKKRLTTIVAAIIVSAAGAMLSKLAGKSVDFGVIAFNVLGSATGGTVIHQLFLRSPESKTCGTPLEIKVG